MKTLLTAVLLFIAVNCQAQGFDFSPTTSGLYTANRNNVFFVDEPVTLNTWGCDEFQIRNYYGFSIGSGSTGGIISLGLLPLGWYKATLSTNGVASGGDTFCVVRRNPAFPRADKSAQGAINDGTSDALMRRMVGKGPYRHAITDLSSVQAAASQVQADIDIDGFGSVMVAFPNGTVGQEATISGIVNALKYKVRVWEGRNEPYEQWGLSAAQYWAEYQAFYDAVKAEDPTATVIGPASYMIGGTSLTWLDQFLALAKNKIDGISFHGWGYSPNAAYPAMFTDPAVCNSAFTKLRSVLAKYNLQNKPLYQTEVSYAAPLYGVYFPQLQGQRTMMHRLLLDQNGVPASRDSLWYDVSHGDWQWPTWWENGDGSDSLQPAAVMYRVYSEEVGGCQYSGKIDFGATGNQIFVGNKYQGNGKTVLAIIGIGSVTLSAPASVVDQFGQSVGTLTVIPVNGVVYVEGAVGVLPIDFGTNLALKATASGPPVWMGGAFLLNNGVDEIGRDGGDTGGAPMWTLFGNEVDPIVTFTWKSVQSISKCLIKCPPISTEHSTLLDYEIQALVNGSWVQVARETQSPQVIQEFTPKNCAASDYTIWWNAKNVFCKSFPSVSTKQMRIIFHKWSFGAFPDLQTVTQYGGLTQYGDIGHWLTVRETAFFR